MNSTLSRYNKPSEYYIQRVDCRQKYKTFFPYLRSIVTNLCNSVAVYYYGD